MDHGTSTKLKSGAALCLSGGGYRALLFHLGGLWRLNELGWLPKIKHVVGVSGGAVAAAWLGLKWNELEFDGAGRAGNFKELVASPLMQLCRKPMDITTGVVGFSATGSLLPHAFARLLFGKAILGDLVDEASGPGITVMCTNLLTGSYAGFNRSGITEGFLGFCSYPGLSLARAVGASCSLPPTFKPVKFSTTPQMWQGDLPPKLKRIRDGHVPLRLCDGGNYDNLGLATVWDEYETVLVSDGSSPMPPWGWLSTDWITASLRSNRVLIDLLRDVRKRVLVEHKFKDSRVPQQGAYWGIASKVANFPLNDPMLKDCDTSDRLANLRTRLGHHTPREIGELVNFGYAMCDTAMRSHLQPEVSRGQWPVGEFGLENKGV